jgi:hypothetical protein
MVTDARRPPQRQYRPGEPCRFHRALDGLSHSLVARCMLQGVASATCAARAVRCQSVAVADEHADSLVDG